MSALDQAIIKAYAKDKSAAPPAGSAAAPHRAEAAPAMPADAGASIERTYHEGLLYRASVPVRAASTASTASATGVPVRAASTASTASATGVPRPHLLSPPPTSPRRGARRSLLRKLAAAPATPPVAAPSEPPPRVARKVIIRHVSHAAPPAPLGLSRLAGTAKTPGAVAEPASPVIELPPETIAQPPVPAETPVPAPAAPPFAPLNAAWPLPPQIEVHCDWHDADAMSAAAVLVESRPAPADRPWQMVAVELEALAAIELIAVEAETQARAVAAAKLPPPPPPPELRAESAIAAETPDAPFAARSFAAKSLSDREEPRPQFRWDAPHAGGWQRPHVRFFPATSSPVTPSGTSSGEDAPPPDSMEAAVAAEIEAPHSEPAHHGDSQPLEPSPESSSPESSPERAAPEYVLEATLEEPCEPPAAAEPRAVEPLTVEELTLAEPLFEPEIVAEPSLDQPLASDLIPHEQDDAWLPGDLTFNASPAEATYAAAESAQAGRPAIPQWEVDSFQWPRTCQKLMADERGYLARAGDKLLAAAQDGLRVLAISGSRRGEGRTTLALCLARAAAKAGLQTAIMDCDFARPQLASKIGLEAAHGWQEAALGNIPLSEAAVKSLADNITVLPLESAAAARKVSLADPRVTATIRAAAATFDLLILDLGPLAAGAAPAFPPGEKCPLDAAIVVRDLRFATATESEAVGHALQDAGVEAVGIAENFVIEDEIPATSV